MTTRYLQVLAVFSVSVTAVAGGEHGELRRFEFSEAIMGTRCRIVLYAEDDAAAAKASAAAFQRIHYLDDTMTDYRDASELMQLCQKAGGPPVPVGAELFFVLKKAQEVSKRSDGAFDVTVGPIVRLWRRAKRQKELPDPKKLAEALALVGWEKIKLDEEKHTVELTKKGMLLDLGGIAKGYAADEALAVLRQQGIHSALAALGGDIAVMGAPPNTEGWTIGIAPLEAPDKPPSRQLILRDAAVSTSGDAEQFVEINGRRYSHIVDPKTGLGLTGHRSVTVVARKGIDADSLTKVVSVLGPERGMPILDSIDGVACLALETTNDGSVAAYESKRWKDVPQNKAAPREP